MATDPQSLKHLLSTTSVTSDPEQTPLDAIPMSTITGFESDFEKLCFTNDEAGDKRLTICMDDMTPSSEGKEVSVKMLEDGEVKKLPLEEVKIFTNLAAEELEEDLLDIVKQLVSVNDSNALSLALKQKIIDLQSPLPDTDGDTLIHFTSRTGSTECLKYLLYHVYEPFPYSLKNDDDYSILHSAINGGIKENIEMILDLVNRCEDVTEKGEITESTEKFLNSKTLEGDTALHLCATFNKKDLIRPLLKAGVKLNITDNSGNSLLHIAATKNLIEFFKIIANYHITDRGDKADARKELKTAFLQQNKEKKVPIFLATDRAVIEIILKYSDVEAVVEKDIGRLIHFAAADNLITLAECLTAMKVELDIVNSKGFSALKVASKRGNEKIVEILLQSGANPNFIGKKVPGFTSLNNAVQFGQLACARLLIDHGADLVHKNMTNTALHSAAFGGHANIVEFLIKDIGMDVNQLNNAKKTALFQSITQGHNSVAKVLLRYGADPNAILNQDNETLVHIAVTNGRKEILKMLLNAKGKPDEPLKKCGETPLMLAVIDDRAEFIPLLMSRGITLAKKDEEGNTLLHHIAKNDSCASARYILKRIGTMKGISQEFQIFKNKNKAEKSAFDVAVECKNEDVLKIFIGYAPSEYFEENPKRLHELYDLKLYCTLKTVFDNLIKVDEALGEVSANTIVFDSNEDGVYPDDKDFKPLKKSLLHKLIDCTEQELKYHLLMNIIVDKKLRFYRWWYVISFFFYLFFFLCLSYALLQASTLCDSRIWFYETPYDWVRGICEVICILYLIFFLFNEAIEFFIEWTQIYNDKVSKVEETALTVKYLSEGAGGTSIITSIFAFWNKTKSFVSSLDRKLKFFLSAFPEYFDGVYNFIDWGGITSFVILILLRASTSYVQWSFAALTFIFFSISLIKYTRIFPALGAYVNSVFRIFVIDIPRFFVIIIIILLAFIGGIHLAARQQPISSQLASAESNDGLPYPICNDSRTAFFWFNPDLTPTYDLRRPLLSGIIFLLDAGPGSYENELLNSNFFFVIIYLLFAFTIVVVMLNILIAQLSQTYGEIVKENSFHYKIDLVVTLELKSNLAFSLGKRFRKLTALESIEISLDYWNQLKENSPNQEVDQVVLGIKTELSRTQKTIDQEFDKAKDSYNDLSEKVNDIGDLLVSTNDRLDTFDKAKDSYNNSLSEKVNDIGDLLVSTKDRLDTFDKALAEIREYILNK